MSLYHHVHIVDKNNVAKFVVVIPNDNELMEKLEADNRYNWLFAYGAFRDYAFLDYAEYDEVFDVVNKHGEMALLVKKEEIIYFLLVPTEAKVFRVMTKDDVPFMWGWNAD